MKRSARVIVASNRAAKGVYEDKTGPVLVAWLAGRGYDVPAPVVVEDGEPVGVALRAALADGVAVVLTTGGTGISPTDRTPDVTRGVLDHELPGVADAIRAAGLPKVPTAVLSRGVAGVAGRTLVVNLPGSSGGVKDGLGVLDGILDHAVDQLAGGDHPRPAAAGPAVRVARALVTEDVLSVDEHARLVEDDAAGAVVTFSGVVRDHDGGKGVRDLTYEGHPSANQVIEDVVAELAARWTGVRAVAVSHRVGALTIGDVALACAVAAEHRGQAFSACAELVDEVKARLPIWKHQHFTDGTDEWVNSP
ncbi:molybdenum cofactor biosynthesis protein MoaE [Amycolatopsis sp. FBCC-B4732]|uniref:Molybdenum cofactor biosynthesis protein MogA-MoaE n=1 Tax=Amycolatopsis orientalis subsp. vinearia TaxID=797057 RepID=A0A023GXK9_AMYOR|nr:molybdenum cofactor biosynthesis protein MoaE [Amycolatopsis sp. FBCC-B4732]AFO69355.1 molybdenum cofactor biosynthesis protein MogA-MoaE [Amycolatopsis orientalis subsp. vinearia]UOX88050.1 molybdenum cofactor biosynthesis protein MoaE [Amycolatopsis sp. FBCC-B4732]